MKNSKDKSVNEAISLLNSEASDAFVEELTSSIDRAIEKAHDESKAHIESVVVLTDSEKKKIESALNKILKREISPVYSVNPSLIGGFRVRVGDWKLDASILHHLDQMKQIL